MLLRALLLMVGICTSWIVQAETETPEDYVKIFQSGSPIEQEKAAQTLEWAGLSSPQLFDLVEAKALASLPKASDKVTINYVAHLTKALAYSGNEKYRPTIEKIIAEAPHKKLKKYAVQALNTLSLHTQINPLIAPKAWPEHSHPTYNQRIVNMLASGNAELMRMAAKRIHFTQNYQPEFLQQLNKTIESTYQQSLDSVGLDAAAWMCRALAGSRMAEYKPTIEKVASGAKEKKLAKYAKKYLAYFGS
ncbi:hypothetical protein [Cellvibrio sp. OA-2007]|uniref:hypothetical protein n=1 Tax=Cellvibrio sp. OA-2007 TaxID=529823 RepID=UPI0007814EA1|nr:hypothetical protein [Cellvibrio sp. OA-2007]